jgi:hypothetical protein
MVLVLVVETGMGMALVREIEIKDDCHVPCQTWTSHAYPDPQGSPMKLSPFHLHNFLDLSRAFLKVPCEQLRSSNSLAPRLST